MAIIELVILFVVGKYLIQLFSKMEKVNKHKDEINKILNDDKE